MLPPSLRAREALDAARADGEVRLDEIRRHYYLTHSAINPRGIVAVQPAVVDFTLSHDRGALVAR